MITKAAMAVRSEKEQSRYSALIDEHLVEIDAINKKIVQQRTAGRKVQASIDRKLKEIRLILDRVEATL
jgi:hypothetical protein